MADKRTTPPVFEAPEEESSGKGPAADRAAENTATEKTAAENTATEKTAAENTAAENTAENMVENAADDMAENRFTKEMPAENTTPEDAGALFPVIEAVLFAAGYPVPYEKLAQLTDTTPEKIRRAVAALAENYREDRFGIQIVEYAEECQMCTKEDYESYVREALGIRQGGRLSNSSLEVLAIVAYHQPVTRSQIEHIRGVDSSYAVSSLVTKKLIEEKGRLDVPGRPVLFGTTSDFLRCFGLSSLDELPDASAFLDSIRLADETSADGIPEDEVLPEESFAEGASAGGKGS